MGGRIQQRTIQPIAVDHPGTHASSALEKVVPIYYLIFTKAFASYLLFLRICLAIKSNSSDTSLDGNGKKRAVAKKSTSKVESQQSSNRGM